MAVPRRLRSVASIPSTRANRAACGTKNTPRDAALVIAADVSAKVELAKPPPPLTSNVTPSWNVIRSAGA
jgi:hypothetical protein